MDDKRKIQIERMKREKQRQLRRRRRQRMIIRRCVLVGGTVAAVLLVISLLWALIKPAFKKDDAGTQVDKSTVNVQAGTPSETPSPETTTEAVNSEESAAATQVTASDGQAVRQPVKDTAELNYPVPGWQVDNSGWWYANEDGTYYENGWAELDGNQYYFNADGYMQTGWAVIGNKGCYFTETGIYEPDKESKMIAMTFDDGPGKYTSELLDVLADSGAKATFFMLGENVPKFGSDTIPRMKALGCELGNHSYSHPNLTNLTADEIRSQIERTDENIAQYADGAAATVVRVPYGAYDESVSANIGKPSIYWNLDTLDWKNMDVDKDIAAVIDKVKDGDIVLMHDIHQPTVEACKTIIPKLVEQGYQLVTVSELAAAKGVTMQDGVTYFDFTAETLAEQKDADKDTGESDGYDDTADTDDGADDDTSAEEQ